MNITRRDFIRIGGILAVSPAIVRASSLMAINPKQASYSHGFYYVRTGGAAVGDSDIWCVTVYPDAHPGKTFTKLQHALDAIGKSRFKEHTILCSDNYQENIDYIIYPPPHKSVTMVGLDLSFWPEKSLVGG